MDEKRPIGKEATWGVPLVVLGALLLLHNYGMLGGLTSGLFFLAGGAAFAWVFLHNHRHWWALFPAFGLASHGLDLMLPGFGRLTGALFLAALGAGFFYVFLTRQQWWAIIPGGTLITLAVVNLVEVFPFVPGGAVFFLGLAATFALVYLIGDPQRRFDWALWPAGALAVLGVINLLSAIFVWMYFWPLLLIGAGVLMLLRNRRNVQ